MQSWMRHREIRLPHPLELPLRPYRRVHRVRHGARAGASHRNCLEPPRMMIPSATYPNVRISAQHVPCAVALRRVAERAEQQADFAVRVKIRTTSDVRPLGRPSRRVYSNIEGLGPWPSGKAAAQALGVNWGRVSQAVR